MDFQTVVGIYMELASYIFWVAQQQLSPKQKYLSTNRQGVTP
jgi:hypothetical protein